LADRQAAAIMTTSATANSDSTSTNNTHVSQWMGVVKRLAAADWFTAKISAAGLVAAVLQLVQVTTTSTAAVGPAAAAADLSFELLTIYKDLCADETPMVRRATAKHLGLVLKRAVANHRDFCSTVLPALCRDEQDSVRLLAVAALAQVGPEFGTENAPWTVQFWLPLVKDGSTDMSWYEYMYTIYNIYDTCDAAFVERACCVCLGLVYQKVSHKHTHEHSNNNNNTVYKIKKKSAGVSATISPNTFPKWPCPWVFKATAAFYRNNPSLWLVSWHYCPTWNQKFAPPLRDIWLAW
jgi:hypothetical protein